MYSYTAGRHHLVKRFLNGIFNLKPSLPKYSFTWDTGIVISYLSQVHQLKPLTYKLATLLAILSGQRAREIVSVIDLRNMDLTDTGCTIRIGNLLNTSGPTIPHKNIETNEKFYRKVAFLMYTEMVNFRP